MSQSIKQPYVIFYGGGGGARGMIPLGMLSQLRNDRGDHFMQGVDCVAGPSTAAIYLSGFNRRNPESPQSSLWSEDDILGNYRAALPRIFHHSMHRHIFGMVADNLPRVLSDDGRLHRALIKRAKYHPEILEGCLKELLGDMKVSDGLRSHIIPTKVYQGDSIRFANILESPSRSTHADIETYKAVMASSMHFACFPTYPIEIGDRKYHCQDGGMIEHPYHVYRIMKNALPEGAEIHMVLLTTGREKPFDCPPKRFDHLGLTGSFHYSNGMPVATEFSDGSYRENMRHLRDDLGERLIEIDYDLAPHYEKSGKVPYMDDAKPEVLDSYDRIAAAVYKEKSVEFDRVKALLDLRTDMRNNPEMYMTAPEPEVEAMDLPEIPAFVSEEPLSQQGRSLRTLFKGWIPQWGSQSQGNTPTFH